jgi:hypothetical protein
MKEEGDGLLKLFFYIYINRFYLLYNLISLSIINLLLKISPRLRKDSERCALDDIHRTHHV